MHMKFLLKSLNFLLVASPLVYAESNECEKFKNHLGDIKESEIDCSTNDNGEINNLTINNNDLTKEQVDKIFSYDLKNLTTLDYTINVGYSSTPSPNEHPGYSEFPSSINNLKSLENLVLTYYNAVHPCSSDCLNMYLTTIEKNTLKDLKNLKSLTLDGVNVSQDNIEEIAILNNLESLTFINSFLSESMNYSSLSKLEKLTSLDITHIRDNYEGRYDGTPIPNSLINSNKLIKNLVISKFSNENIVLEDFPNLEKLHIPSDIKNYKIDIKEKLENLTDLEFEYITHGYFSLQQIDLNIDFSKMRNLKSLDISRINLSEQNMKDIASLSNLNQLSFGSCVFTKVTLNKLTQMESLTSLSFEYCEIEEKKFNVLKNMNKLTSLTIKGCDLNQIPDSVSSLTNLQSLNVQGNNISGEIPEFLNNLPHLKEVYFGRNQFEGKTLTNPNLVKCDYTENLLLCLAKKMDCIKDQDIKSCSNIEQPVTTTKVESTVIEAESTPFETESIPFEDESTVVETEPTPLETESTVIESEPTTITKTITMIVESSSITVENEEPSTLEIPTIISTISKTVTKPIKPTSDPSDLENVDDNGNDDKNNKGSNSNNIKEKIKNAFNKFSESMKTLNLKLKNSLEKLFNKRN